MANQDWYDLGDQIRHIVQDAVDSKDFRTLNQTINSTINSTLHNVGDSIRNAAGDTQGKQKQRTHGRHKDTAWNREQRADFPYGSHTYQDGGRTSPPTVKNRVKDHRGAGLALTIVGGIFTGVFGFTLLGTGLGALITGSVLAKGVLIAASIAVPFFAAGVVMTSIGSRKYSKANRFRQYLRGIKDKTYCNLKELESLTGKSRNYIIKDLKSMIQDGWFPEGHLDEEGTCLITSDQTYQEYLKSRQYQEEQRQQASEQASAEQKMPQDLREIIQEGKAFLQQIRAANDAIPGEEISNKISHMELIVRKIFQRVEQHPEVIDDLRKLMEYYLPTTIKLLDAYEELDKQPVQGENIISSKHEIENTIDTLNLAFEKLLDSLFKDTAWDISSDISVLHTMLAQEGLTKDDF